MKPNGDSIGIRSQSSGSLQACFLHDFTQSILLRFMYIFMYVCMPCLFLFTGRWNVYAEARGGQLDPLEL